MAARAETRTKSRSRTGRPQARCRTNPLPGAQHSPMSSRTSPAGPPVTIRRTVARDAKRLTRLVRGSGAYVGQYAAAVTGYRVGPDYIEAHRSFPPRTSTTASERCEPVPRRRIRAPCRATVPNSSFASLRNDGCAGAQGAGFAAMVAGIQGQDRGARLCRNVSPWRVGLREAAGGNWGHDPV
ncbi:protein of unknown function [Streptomyces murinus]